MKRKIYLAALFLSAGFLFAGCDSDDENEINNPTEKLPAKIIEKRGAENYTSTFKYNDKHQIVEFAAYEGQDWGYTVNFFYEGDELLYTTTWWNDNNKITQLDYSKTGNTITSTGNENEKGDIRDVTYIININETGLPTSINDPYGYIWTYKHDAKGNVVEYEDKYIETEAISVSSTHNYDNNKGLFSMCTTPKWWWYQNREYYNYLYNNLTKTIYTKGSDVSTWTYSIKTDADMYPVSITSDDVTYTIEYKSI